MDRIEIESKLNRDRAWLLDAYAKLSPDDLARGASPSEHDPASLWSARDHLVHLAGIERVFVDIVRRHLEGDANPVGVLIGGDGQRRALPDIMKDVHERNERDVRAHAGASLSAVVALGQQARAQTLALLASLSDEQLGEKVPGAPWADGTIGGILAVNADHGRMHWKWLQEGLAGQTS